MALDIKMSPFIGSGSSRHRKQVSYLYLWDVSRVQLMSNIVLMKLLKKSDMSVWGHESLSKEIWVERRMCDVFAKDSIRGLFIWIREEKLRESLGRGCCCSQRSSFTFKSLFYFLRYPCPSHHFFLRKDEKGTKVLENNKLDECGEWDKWDEFGEWDKWDEFGEWDECIDRLVSHGTSSFFTLFSAWLNPPFFVVICC